MGMKVGVYKECVLIRTWEENDGPITFEIESRRKSPVTISFWITEEGCDWSEDKEQQVSRFLL